jgi:prepilin-type processing-associated H-X9-DG protein
MNNWMGGESYGGQDTFRVYRNIGEIGTPAKRFVIAEEREDSINDGVLLGSTGDEIVDFPGVYHANGAWFSFADGHVEHRRWTDPRTTPGFRDSTFIPLVVPNANNPDLDWLHERMTELK